MTLNYLLWSVAGPATWPLWLALLIVLCLLSHNIALARRLGWWWLLLTLLLAVLPTGDRLLRLLEGAYAQIEAPGDTRDIVVLAGGENIAASLASGRPETGAHGDRLLAGATLARSHPEARLWIVGGIARDGLSDIAIAQRLWRGLGVPPEQVRVIDDTTDTCGNLTGVAKALGGRPVLLVTSAFHMPRAMLCAAAAGVDARPYPVDYQSGPALPLTQSLRPAPLDRLLATDLALHEFVGIGWYRLSGRTQALWPVENPN